MVLKSCMIKVFTVLNLYIFNFVAFMLCEVYGSSKAKLRGCQRGDEKPRISPAY